VDYRVTSYIHLRKTNQHHYGIKYHSIQENTVNEKGVVVSSKPMYITNEFIQWTFCPYITKIERIHLKGKHKLNIYTKNNQIDENKAITSFASILIHSIDAHIVFLYETMIKDIQSELQAKGIHVHISTFTNDDNFGIKK